MMTLTINNDIFNPALDVIAKVKFDENALEFPAGFDSLTENDHKQLWTLLLKCNRSSLFWIGDYLANCGEKVTIVDSNGKVKEHVKHKVYEMVADVTGYSVQTLRKAKYVCARIPKDKRNDLSFDHHKECISGCRGDITIASTFLKDAKENNYSISKLRSEVRTFWIAPANRTKTTLTPSDGDKDFAECVTTIQKALSIIQKDNLSDAQKDHLLLVVADIMKALED